MFSLFRLVQPEIVYHLAAILSARGEEVPQHTYNVNQSGTFNVLEACRETGVRQMVFTSSIAVYGPGLPDPTPDTAPLEPTTMYGVTKAAGELLGKKFAGKAPGAEEALRQARARLEALPGWDHDSLEQAMRSLAEGLELKAGDLFMLLRVALTGRPVSPPLFESMEVLGRERCLRRLNEALTKLSHT